MLGFIVDRLHAGLHVSGNQITRDCCGRIDLRTSHEADEKIAAKPRSHSTGVRSCSHSTRWRGKKRLLGEDSAPGVHGRAP